MQPSAGKIICIISYDPEGVVLTDYICYKRQSQTPPIQGCSTRCQIQPRKHAEECVNVLILHDNAPPHMARVSKAATREMVSRSFNHSPSTRLIPQHGLLCIPSLSQFEAPLEDKQFSSNE